MAFFFFQINELGPVKGNSDENSRLVIVHKCLSWALGKQMDVIFDPQLIKVKGNNEIWHLHCHTKFKIGMSQYQTLYMGCETAIATYCCFCP